MSVIVSVNGNIQLTDNTTGVSNLVKLLQQSFTGTNSSFVQSQTLANGTTNLILPIIPCQFVYVKNLHNVNTATVIWTPNAGFSALVNTLEPGALIILAGQTLISGVQAVSILTTAPGTTVEYILAG